MTEHGAVEPPDIPDSADQEVPPNDDLPTANPNASTQVDDPDAAHKRKVDLSKLKFAIWFTAISAAVAVVLPVVEYFTPGFAESANGGLGTASDAMKMLATTSLGYIFGRSVRPGDD